MQKLQLGILQHISGEQPMTDDGHRRMHKTVAWWAVLLDRSTVRSYLGPILRHWAKSVYGRGTVRIPLIARRTRHACRMPS
jgi:hypothetical protein